MHPAYSVIFFTTATGAGYGLLALLGILAGLGLVPPDLWLGLVSLGIAFGLIATGLLSSTGHLGRPERAWRAFSQWRTSWLSREGVASVVTFVPAGVFAWGWIFLGRTDGWVAAAGVIAALGATLTVIATAMIYRSLKPIPQWYSPFTVPGYLLLSWTSGTLLLVALQHVFGMPSQMWNMGAILLTAAAWIWKRASWRRNDAVGLPVDLNSATGLKSGTVRSIEWPHTEENYLLKEMGFRVARKHRLRLRSFVEMAGFAVPMALLVVALFTPVIAAIALCVLAALIQFSGLLVERWLFFAEAKHTVTLYYGRE